jgi:hypothetical protein
VILTEISAIGRASCPAISFPDRGKTPELGIFSPIIATIPAQGKITAEARGFLAAI